MPVQYPAGVLAEHLHTRSGAGLFDVSHMGQLLLPLAAAQALETLTPCDVLGLKEGRQTYGVFTTPSGGTIDDFMLARRTGDFFLVVNASRTARDVALLSAIGLTPRILDRALLALQGPLAESVLARLIPPVAAMKFLQVAEFEWGETTLWISRSGYTGEDGFEISVAPEYGELLAKTLLAMTEVEPIGLGARDTLRLEAGMPLYGNDLTEEISPVEAGLTWAIGRARRAGGDREGGFPGHTQILKALAESSTRHRVGVKPDKTPFRQGITLFNAPEGGEMVGSVTSGGFSPSLKTPIAMAYVNSDVPLDAPLFGEVRGRRVAATQTALPFLPHQYRR